MTVESAGRRAGRIEQDGVEPAMAVPGHGVGGDQLGDEAGALEIFGEAL